MIFLFSKHPNGVFASYDNMALRQVTPRLKKVCSVQYLSL